MTRHIANILTSCRILGSVILLFLPVFSSPFYITYLFCGFSDMIDGAIARKTNSVSDFGSKIDTAADLVFVAVSFIKLLPTIHIPWWLWICYNKKKARCYLYENTRCKARMVLPNFLHEKALLPPL